MSTKNEKIDEKLTEAKKSCDAIANNSSDDAIKLIAHNQKMAITFYEVALAQAKQSFKSALFAAYVGTGFFVVALALCMFNEKSFSTISVIAGGLIQVISAINFLLYGKTSRQLSSFHSCLERTSRFTFASSIADRITCSVKRDNAKYVLLNKIVDAPMITVQEKNESKVDVDNGNKLLREINVDGQNVESAETKTSNKKMEEMFQ